MELPCRTVSTPWTRRTERLYSWPTVSATFFFIAHTCARVAPAAATESRRLDADLDQSESSTSATPPIAPIELTLLPVRSREFLSSVGARERVTFSATRAKVRTRASREDRKKKKRKKKTARRGGKLLRARDGARASLSLSVSFYVVSLEFTLFARARALRGARRRRLSSVSTSNARPLDDEVYLT